MTTEEIKQLIKDYIKENLDIFISRSGYNDELIIVEVTLEGEEVAKDSVRIS